MPDEDGPGGHPPPPAKCGQCDRYMPCPVHGGATTPPGDTPVIE